MKELKTLNDLDEIDCCISCEEHTATDTVRKELGIKWIKDIWFAPNNETSEFNRKELSFGQEKQGAVKILKHIFNITDEDLK